MEYIWTGLQENVLGNQFSMFDSPRDHPQGIHPCAPPRERGSVPQATGTKTLFRMKSRATTLCSTTGIEERPSRIC